MPTDFRPAPSTDPDEMAAMDERNQARLQGWWDMAGVEPHYPLSTDEAVRLLQSVDYAADHDTLLAYVNEGIIPPVVPRDERGKLSWGATAIVTVACALEARRKWKPFSQLHGHKLTMIEKLMQIHEANGENAFTDLASYDLDGLLGLLHQAAGDVGAVQILTEAVRRKLQLQGIL